MRIKYTSRKGRYNICNPQEESISCHIQVIGDDGVIIKSTNIHPEYELDGYDVDEILDELKSADKRVFYSTCQKEWQEMIKFLEENKDKIEEGNKQYRITEIKKIISKLQDELLSLSSKVEVQ